MARMKSLNSDGKAIFVSFDGKKYEKEIPRDLLKIISLCTLNSVNVWHYEFEEYRVIGIYNEHLNDWGDVPEVSIFFWGDT